MEYPVAKKKYAFLNLPNLPVVAIKEANVKIDARIVNEY